MVEAKKIWLGAYIAIYWQLIVGWKISQSQYRTSLEGQDMTVSPPYSQDRYTGHCGWASVECNCLCWKILVPLSHCWYVAIQKNRSWNCHRNPCAELTVIHGSHDASCNIRNGIHTVQWISGAPEHWLLSTKLQTGPSGWWNPLWTASGLFWWYHKSLSRADSQRGLNQRYSRCLLQFQHRIDRPEIAHAWQRLCLPPCKPLLLQQSSFEPDFWRICFWDQLP